MILIQRGPEPAQLVTVRAQKMAELMALRASGITPGGNDIKGYREPSAQALYKAQHHKCCYCEQKIKLSYNHVDHFRPKGRAERGPGSTATTGYWWLAYIWENLLFACPSCNSSAKKDLFPLDHGSIPLNEHELPPEKELPLLIDPAGPHNPVCEIMFKYEKASKTGTVRHWYARPRNGSKFGAKTIAVLKLNEIDLLGLRDDYFEERIQEKIIDLRQALDTGQRAATMVAYHKAQELLKPRHQFVGLAYDALCQHIDDARLRACIQLGWPEPRLVAV